MHVQACIIFLDVRTYNNTIGLNDSNEKLNNHLLLLYDELTPRMCVVQIWNHNVILIVIIL